MAQKTFKYKPKSLNVQRNCFSLGYEPLRHHYFVRTNTEDSKQTSSQGFNFQNFEKPCIGPKDTKNMFSIFILEGDRSP